MKIALISPYDFPYPGGVTEHIAALAQGMQQRGHEVHILAANSGHQSKLVSNVQAVTQHVTTVCIAGATARVGLSPLSFMRLKKILQHEAFDVLHLHEPLTPGITWWSLLLASALPRTVTIGTFHAYHERPNWLYAQGKPIFRYFFSQLDSLIAVSKAAHAFADRMFPGDYRIIPNGVDLMRFGQKSKTKLTGAPDPLTILFVGRLDRRKGFVYLLEAFWRLKPHYPQLRLRVVGPFTAQESQSYQRCVQAHGVTDVEFVGYVPPEELPTFYHQAHIFCAPSMGFESFGIVLLEAMAAGVPVIASDIAGYRTLIVDGQEGLLTPPGQPEALAAALGYLLDRPWLRQKMGRLGQLKARNYSWDGIVDKVLDVYQDTIEYKGKIQCDNKRSRETRLNSSPAHSAKLVRG
ncbi:MAG: glycosyltransferase family 4 protein [Anaerolineae bacterium]